MEVTSSQNPKKNTHTQDQTKSNKVRDTPLTTVVMTRAKLSTTNAAWCSLGSHSLASESVVHRRRQDVNWFVACFSVPVPIPQQEATSQVHDANVNPPNAMHTKQHLSVSTYCPGCPHSNEHGHPSHAFFFLNLPFLFPLLHHASLQM